MDKNAVKIFAVESRRQLIESVKYQASLIGIAAEGISEPISKAEGMETYDYGAGTHTIFDEDISKRESLVQEIKNKGFDNVIEEVAYTWFNRIIAIRFMEVNDYLPTRTRVLSSEIEGKIEPDIVTEALDLELDYSPEDGDLILKLKDENKLDELFQFLFIKQCNKLNEILPGLFKKTDDYMELLFNISFTNEEGIVRQLINQVPEENFRNQVEIIGWLYQFYNTELKDEAFDNIKKKIKVIKERIPAVTQLFTPDWIVKYMVENSLGRLWLEQHPNINLKSKWKYYVDAEDENSASISDNKNVNDLNLEEIKIIDPSMGSGHILIYIFDVLMDIYISEGYTETSATELILKNNICGFDIDDRAYQLAYFSLMMKARSFNRRFFEENISPLVFSIQESDMISDDLIQYIISKSPEIKDDFTYLINIFKNAKMYGSILKIKQIDFEKITLVLNDLINFNDLYYLRYKDEINLLFSLINQAKYLYKEYDIVVTNPPYMGNGNMNPTLKDYLKSNFPDSKHDLFSVFIERSFTFSKKTGHVGLLTPYVWMFLSSFNKLREKIINNKSITSLVQLEYNAFPEACVPVCIFTFKNDKYDVVGEYIKLSDFKGVEIQEVKTLEAINDFNCEYRYHVNSDIFSEIPRNPIAYWIDNNLIHAFKEGISLNKISDIKVGLQTGDNTRFLRYWFEVNSDKLDIPNLFDGSKWYPHNKGGSFRKWYGNQDYVINYENDGLELINSKKANISSIKFQFKESICWSRISNSNISFRYFPDGFLFDSATCALFLNQSINKNYILGLLNSNVAQFILGFIAPTLNYQAGDIGLIPIFFSEEYGEIIDKLVGENINICNDDWDDYETSWNFKKNPLIKNNFSKIEDSFKSYELLKEEKFNKIKDNEVYLNNLFNEIYSLNLDSSVRDMHISVIKADYEKDIKAFISYAVGCMFGRYNIDSESLQFAGSEFNLNNYNNFIPDDDNIIPILDTEYFEDDIVGRFVEFVKVCFGTEYLEENLDFIAGALKKKGKTSREIIRNYFLTDFFKDHAKMYKKCPIYWQFDSGKQNAFKCLIYMHRYEPDIVARVRTDYLHKTQKAIEQNLAHCDNIIANSSNKSEVSKATKDKSKYIKQLDEIRTYDEVLGHMANQHVEIDLDDGVKVNYAKFQNIEISKEGEKTKKINLLKRI